MRIIYKKGFENMNNVGKIVQIIGPVLDIRFEDGELPNILKPLKLTIKVKGLLRKLHSI